MLRQTSFLLMSAALLYILGAPADAASFDCNRARTAEEIAICKSPLLSGLDSEMGGLWYAYRQFPFLMGMSGVRQDEANAFLQSRGKCGPDEACLAKVYRARIQQLREDIKGAIDGMQKQIDAAQKR
jgi:uncharacterized protein